jgi:HTH-type transcriptional regulator / antitoxin HigA
MTLKTIKTEQEYDELMDWIDQQFDKKVRPDSPAGEALQVALLLVKAYEDEHYPILPPDPIEAIRLKMSEQGIRNKDFVGRLGSKSYVSAVLNRRKPMTLDMAKFFHKELGIPAAILLR